MMRYWRAVRAICLVGTVLMAAGCADSEQCKPAVALPAPRGDDRLEVLAAILSPGVSADPAVYDRLKRDVQNIHTQHPATSDIDYSPPHDGRSLLIELNPFATAQVMSGIYDDWDCLNQQYHVDSVNTKSRPVQLKFKAVYDLAKLAPSYARLPGVRWAEPKFNLVSEQRKTICVVPRGSEWHFVLQRFGDSDNVLYHFTTAANGLITAADSWSVPDSSVAFEADQPPWVDEFWNSDACKR